MVDHSGSADSELQQQGIANKKRNSGKPNSNMVVMEHLDANLDDDFSYSRNNEKDKLFQKSKFHSHNRGQNSQNQMITTSNDDYNTTPIQKVDKRHGGTVSATEFRASRIGRHPSPVNNATAAYGGESRTNFTNQSNDDMSVKKSITPLQEHHQLSPPNHLQANQMDISVNDSQVMGSGRSSGERLSATKSKKRAEFLKKHKEGIGKQSFAEANKLITEEKQIEEDTILMIKRTPKWKKKVFKFMQHGAVTATILVATLYALFGDDIRVAFFNRSADEAFNVITLIIMILFAIEIVINSAVDTNYLLSFYFWLDLISTVSLIMDISWIWEGIVGEEEDYNAVQSNDAQFITEASQSARIGSRTARITRVIRLVRLIRISRLWKAANSTLNKRSAPENEEIQEELRNQATINAMKRHKELESKKKDGDKIQRRAALLKSSTSKVPEINVEDESGIRQDSRVNDSNISEHQESKIGDTAQNVMMTSHSQGLGISQSLIQSQDTMDISMMLENQGTQNESKVGKILSESTQKAVISLVLSMLLSAAVLDLHLFAEPPHGFAFGLKVLTYTYGDAEAFQVSFDAYLNTWQDGKNPLIQVIVEDFVWSDGTDLDDLRPSEKQVSFYVSPVNDKVSVAVHDLSYQTRVAAILGIVTTLLICVVLAAGSLVLSKFIQNLVLSPIEEMMQNVKAITEDPIQAAQQAEEDAVKQEEHEKALGRKAKSMNSLMETEVLQKTLNKIGGLLAIGFGEAGSKIIAQNMRKGDDVDPLLPGLRSIAIFGFCDIRKFTDATEVLQEGVMLFVNEIGEIVHGIVDRFQGAANKNIGDAFLLVWKFDDDSVLEDRGTGELSLIRSNKVSQLCDMTLISFLKIIASTKRSRKMRKYANHAGLNKRMPNYEVKMGFGLHQGWAIEGALGSYYKIDASYLSPNVNVSSKLEEETKTYETPILVSGELHDHFTDACKQECRQIDNILFKGKEKPMKLFTCDIDFSELTLEPQKPQLNNEQQRTARVKSRLQRNAFKSSVMLGEIDVSLLFQTDQDIIEMRAKFPQVFLDVFNEGFKNFIGGNWNRSRKQLRQVESIKRMPDRPSQILLEYMEKWKFEAPEDWKGYRVQED